MPTHCPLCGVEIVKPEGEVMHRCPNRACPSRGLESLINWVQAAADIDGVGEQLVRRLWELGLVRSLPELYRLSKEELLELDGFGETSATNVINSIAASKEIPFRRVLFGLNIPDVGWVTAQRLARHFGDVDRLRTASQEEIVECEGIGPERAEAIAEWFADEDNERLVAELRALGLRFESGDEDRPVEGPLSGRQYVVTGTLETFSREQARAALEALGAKVSDNVSKKTAGVIVGESPGSKVAKAEKAGVPLLTEDDLKALVGQAGEPTRARSRSGPAPVVPGGSQSARRSEAPRRRSGCLRSPRAPTPRRSCPSSHARRRGRQKLHPVLERSVDARDRQCGPERMVEDRLAPRGGEERCERSSGQAIVEREAGAVDDAHTGERNTGRRQSAPDDCRAAAVVPLHPELRAELLHHQLGCEVVALTIHLLEDRRQPGRLDLSQRVGVAGARPRPTAPLAIPCRRRSWRSRPAAASAGRRATCPS